VNNDLTGEKKYCVKKFETLKMTNSSTTTTVANTQVKSTSTTVQNTVEQSTESTTFVKIFDDVKVAPVSHIWGGIFYPIFIVFGFLGTIFAIKKYNLIERAHRIIRNRNQNYHGLMENEFDDDDPLLI
jgi:hypothetical protein